MRNFLNHLALFGGTLLAVVFIWSCGVLSEDEQENAARHQNDRTLEPSRVEQPPPDSETTNLDPAETLASSKTEDARIPRFSADEVAALFEEFDRRIETYLKLRKEADDGIKKPGDEEMPEEIEAYQKQLGSRLIQARNSAKQGDLFFPEIQSWFQSVINTGLTADEKAALKDSLQESGAYRVRPAVNLVYPPEAGVSTVLPGLLRTFPELPEELEYRFVDSALILLDRDTKLILDYLPAKF